MPVIQVVRNGQLRIVDGQKTAVSVVYISTIDIQLFGSSNMAALVGQLLTLDVNRFSLYTSVRII